jgi:hypothetical protein
MTRKGATRAKEEIYVDDLSPEKVPYINIIHTDPISYVESLNVNMNHDIYHNANLFSLVLSPSSLPPPLFFASQAVAEAEAHVAQALEHVLRTEGQIYDIETEYLATVRVKRELERGGSG